MPKTVVENSVGESHTQGVQPLNGLDMKRNNENSKPNTLDRIFDFLGVDSYGKISNATKETSANIAIGVLGLGFIISFSCFFTFWFTGYYNNNLLANLALINNTKAVEWWINPPLNTLMKVHVFNYTNVEAFLNGTDEQLKVVDLGPYVYRETMEKVNIEFNPNHTITYKEKKRYEFVPEMSNGFRPTDKVVIPNIPMIAASKTVKDANFLKRLALKTMFSTSHSKVFKNLEVRDFLWGYRDELVAALSTFIELDVFGILMNTNKTSKDTFTINSGEDDLAKLALFDNINGFQELTMWPGDLCNQINGTDGSQFPPHTIDKKTILHVYIKNFCRKFPLKYSHDVTLFDGIPAWRYEAPSNVFSYTNNPDNQCYCLESDGQCPMDGLFDSSKCLDAPIYTSFPHFYHGDKRLLNATVIGLKPNAKLHSTYADLHPRLAFPIDGASRFQVNVRVETGSLIEDFKKDAVLPVIWLEVVPGELSEELRGMIYHSSFSVNAVEMYFKYGSLLACVIFGTLLAIVLYCRSQISSEVETVRDMNVNFNKSMLTKLTTNQRDTKDKTVEVIEEGQELEKVMNTD